MLKNTFLHIPGLGVKSEQRIWFSGISSWDDLSDKGCTCFSPYKQEIIRRFVEDSIEHLSRGNPNYFGNLLHPGHFWRFFPEFRKSTAYLDIETTGLDTWGNEITTKGIPD